MQDSNNPQPQDTQDQPAATFKPAPNPFEKSTTAPVETTSSAQEETQVPPEPEQDLPVTAPGAQNDIELVGKRADEKPESGQLEQPKKRSAVAAVFSPFSKKPEPTDTKTKHKNLNKEKVPEQTLMSWQAPEFVQTHKPAGWYLGFGAFFLVLILLALFTRQYLTVGLFAIMGVVLVIYANRTPRILKYQVTNYGVVLGEKKYLFDDFGSYYETSDYGQPVLELVPNKRFGTLVSLPPAQNQVDELEKTLSQMLPKVDNRDDVADKIFRALRF